MIAPTDIGLSELKAFVLVLLRQKALNDGRDPASVTAEALSGSTIQQLTDPSTQSAYLGIILGVHTSLDAKGYTRCAWSTLDKFDLRYGYRDGAEHMGRIANGVFR